MLFYKAFHLRVLGVPFYLRGPPIICSGSNDQRFASLDPFKLAGNYSQKSGNPISEILISKIFRGGPTTAPAPPIDFLATALMMNNKIEQKRYNNHELGYCIKSGFVCSNKRENNPSRFAKLYVET